MGTIFHTVAVVVPVFTVLLVIIIALSVPGSRKQRQKPWFGQIS